MSYWSRIRNVFRGGRLNSEIDEELQSHIDEAVASGREPSEVRHAFGSRLRAREYSRDVKIAARLESLGSDAVFSFRQLAKNKISSAAAVLSLALAIGACTSAFRLIDAVLLRPLPVSDPDRLYFITHQYTNRSGVIETDDNFEYPLFRQLRSAVQAQAELLAIAQSGRIDLTYRSDHEMEKAYRQYVSGSMFSSFGIKPALGRLLTPEDDMKPGAHPYAVLGYDYWTRRFGRDPKIVGRTFRSGGQIYEIVGVAGEGFTGTETGTLTDIFVPTMMNAKAINNANWSWFRTWVRLKPGTRPEQVRERLQAEFTGFRKETAKGWSAETPKERVDDYVNAPIFLEPAAAGVSGMQKNYRRSLATLAGLVALVLLIACANVANLMTAQAASRAREMALRVSIGAGRSRLVQLVLVESALIALLASLLGWLFAWWSAPFVVGMLNPPDEPARLILPADWRVLGFGAALGLAVTLLFGLVPALRASGVKPMITLKGGEDPRSRRRVMNTLVAAQVAFCFLVHFLAGLFVASFERLSTQPTGFSAQRVLVLESGAASAQPSAHWNQVVEHLRSLKGVESAALCGWALMSGNGWSSDIRVNGGPPTKDNPYFLSISPGWIETMRIRMLDGRDIRPEEAYPKVAVVNESFAKRYFDGQSPVGKSFEQTIDKKRVHTQIVGYVADARYRNMREAIRPTVYVPFHSLDVKGGLRSLDWGSFVVRTEGDPVLIAQMLRQEVQRTRPEFRVSNVRTQQEIVRSHTLRERLLAMLSLFFATVALVLAGVGLYGVLTYSVLQRRREIGIRMALGARAGDVARRVTTEVFGMLVLGALAGLTAGVVSERYIETLLYQVKATDVTMLALPALTIFAAALVAALPPVIHAVRIDPATTLRTE
jgi:putative ABC transport system permease protein